MNIDYLIIISNGDDRLRSHIFDTLWIAVNKHCSKQACSFIFVATVLL